MIDMALMMIVLKIVIILLMVLMMITVTMKIAGYLQPLQISPTKTELFLACAQLMLTLYSYVVLI